MRLILEDGMEFLGQSFGATKDVKGEVVFNTGMSGYVETLTDPSYKGQLLVLTYPLQGNYGVPSGPFESSQIQVQGLIISHYCNDPNHHAMVRTLSDWLKSEGVPAITGIDTRTLTRHLRSHGTMPGTLTHSMSSHVSMEENAIDMKHVLDLVGTSEIKRYGRGDLKVLLIDTGAKENIIRSLVNRGAEVIRVPWHANFEDYYREVDAVFLTNGPGNPQNATGLVLRIRHLLERDLPIFGICFGHQLLALAAGATTEKMLFGNRSVNQPVRDLKTNRCYITSQNHGYVVNADSLPDDFEPWFENLNDKTNEGIRHRFRPISSVQFHPEACPGPNDTAFLFDEFMEQVRAHKALKAHNQPRTINEETIGAF